MVATERYWRLLKVAGLVLLIAGCQTAPRSGFCDAARPIRLSDATVDAMSDAEVNAALAQNETGAKLCGWKP